jgi:hypothetical protein
MNRRSSVGIATGYGLDDLGSVPEKGKKVFSSPLSRPALGSTKPPIQFVPWGKAAGS